MLLSQLIVRVSIAFCPLSATVFELYLGLNLFKETRKKKGTHKKADKLNLYTFSPKRQTKIHSPPTNETKIESLNGYILVSFLQEAATSLTAASLGAVSTGDFRCNFNGEIFR